MNIEATVNAVKVVFDLKTRDVAKNVVKNVAII